MIFEWDPKKAESNEAKHGIFRFLMLPRSFLRISNRLDVFLTRITRFLGDRERFSSPWDARSTANLIVVAHVEYDEDPDPESSAPGRAQRRGRTGYDYENLIRRITTSSGRSTTFGRFREPKVQPASLTKSFQADPDPRVRGCVR